MNDHSQGTPGEPAAGDGGALGIGVQDPAPYAAGPETPGAAAVAPAGPDAPLALIVYHGMGQQVPFETAQQAVALIRRGAALAGHREPTVNVRQVTLGGQPFTRAEVTLAGKAPAGNGTAEDGAPGARRVALHIYECYWAPLTEGKITLAETASFLLNAGWNGLCMSLSSQPFPRWLFGRVRQLVPPSPVRPWHLFVAVLALVGLAVAVNATLPAADGPGRAAVTGAAVLGLYVLFTLLLRRTARYLLFALLVVLSLVSINATIGTITTASSLRAGIAPSPGWPSPHVRENLTVDLAAGVTAVAAFAALGIGVPVLRRRGRPADIKDGARLPYRIAVGLALASLVGTAVAVVIHCFLAPGARPPLFQDPPLVWVRDGVRRGGAVSTALFVVVWGGAFALSRFVSLWLVDYLGDVAIYVSAHRVNRFSETRQQIRAVASDVTCAVFSARAPRDPAAPGPEAPGPAETPAETLLYSEVLVVGHSLGSVIGYDALSAALLADQREPRGWRVAERTRLLLTFGSPLDKVAFLFRSQAGTDATPVREAMAASVQPMIVHGAWRPDLWLNLWSPDDWISGDLNFFDPPPQDGPACPDLPMTKRVRNKQDLQAWTPLACHSDYWKNDLLPEYLYGSVMAPTKQALAALLPDPGDHDEPPRYVPKRRREYDQRQARLKEEVVRAAREEDTAAPD